MQVRLCLEREDYVRAQILSNKVSPRAFVAKPDRKDTAGEIGIEGTAIEEPEEVRGVAWEQGVGVGVEEAAGDEGCGRRRVEGGRGGC